METQGALQCTVDASRDWAAFDEQQKLRCLSAARAAAQRVDAALTRLRADTQKAFDNIDDFTAQLHASIDAHMGALKEQLAQARATHAERLEREAVYIDVWLQRFDRWPAAKWNSAEGAANAQHICQTLEFPQSPSDVCFDAAGVQDATRACLLRARVMASCPLTLDHAMFTMPIPRVHYAPHTPTGRWIKVFFDVSVPAQAVSASALSPTWTSASAVSTDSTAQSAAAAEEVADELAMQLVEDLNRRIAVKLFLVHKDHDSLLSPCLSPCVSALCASREYIEMTHSASGLDIVACAQLRDSDVLFGDAATKFCILVHSGHDSDGHLFQDGPLSNFL